VEHGHLATLRWLHEQGCPWNTDRICGEAAESGSLEMLLYLRQQGCEYNEYSMLSAATSGELAICQHLAAEQCPCGTDVCDRAASCGRFEVFHFLQGIGCPWDVAKVTRAAAMNGSVAMLQCLMQQGCVLSTETVGVAARSGHLETVRFLHESGCPWDVDTICADAVKMGSIELLQYLKQQRCAFTADVMRAAALKDDLHMCQYLYAEQCPWTKSATEAAARCRHVDTLRWLLQQGCPYDAHAVRLAAAGEVEGNLSVLKYALSFEPAATAAQLTELLNAAGHHRYRAAAKWLRQQGAEWPAELRYGRFLWDTNMLQWARNEGCTSLIHDYLLQVCCTTIVYTSSSTSYCAARFSTADLSLSSERLCLVARACCHNYRSTTTLVSTPPLC
jgi:hypothetical protein